ncbi:MAG: helix-turn-helix domain-containing protein [Actinomycetota bacterium]|nr:helix-turn-helix domain-containing protein [Actinomycetota bacterium]
MSPAGRDHRRSGLERLTERLATFGGSDPSVLFAAIAAQVTARRLAWDLSQKELADLCGTTQSAIARIEAGRRPPRIDTLERVATALDCELSIELRPRTEGTNR